MDRGPADVMRSPGDRLVLVTGGTGYVGSVLVPHLASLGFRVRVYCSMAFGNPIAGTPGVEFIEGDVRDVAKLRLALKGVTDVVHLAAIVTDELVDMNPRLARDVNEGGMRTLLDLALAAGVGRFVYASSSSVYGAQPDGEVATEITVPNPMTEYARTKLRGEEIALEQASHMTIVIVRSATCAGPAPRMRLDTIVNIFSKQAWFDGILNVHGGDQWRTNIHVRDVADFYALMLTSPKEIVAGKVYNAAKEAMTAMSIANLVVRVRQSFRLDLPPVIKIDEVKRDARNYRMSGARSRQELGWWPIRSIEDAVRDNFRFFLSGGVKDPENSVYKNTERMREFMTNGR